MNTLHRPDLIVIPFLGDAGRLNISLKELICLILLVSCHLSLAVLGLDLVC